MVGTATLAERPTPYVAGRRAGAGQAQRRAEPARRLDADGPAVDPRAGRGAGRGPAGLHPRRHVVGPARGVPRGGTARPLRLASNAGDLLMEAYTTQVFQSRLATTSRLPTHLGCVLDCDPQAVPPALDWPRTFNACQVGGLLAAGRAGRGPVPLGPVRRPAGLVPPQSPGDRGRAPDRVPQGGAARLALALGRRFRDDRRAGGRLRPAGRHAIQGQGAALARRAPGGRRRDPRPDRGGAGADRRPGHPGRPPGRSHRPR